MRCELVSSPVSMVREASRSDVAWSVRRGRNTGLGLPDLGVDTLIRLKEVLSVQRVNKINFIDKMSKMTLLWFCAAVFLVS